MIESKTGNILVIPKATFLNNSGEIAEGNVEIEFAEASEIDEMILSNMVIQDSTNIFETQLTFFINAKQNNQQLAINPESSIYFELSADKHLSLYKGNRDKNGNMDWGAAISPVDYLVPVPIQILDFYPPGFENEVEKGLPFKNHEITSKKLLDSLFYSFALRNHYSANYHPNNNLAMISFVAPVLKLFAQDDAWEVDSDTSNYNEMVAGLVIIFNSDF